MTITCVTTAAKSARDLCVALSVCGAIFTVGCKPSPIPEVPQSHYVKKANQSKLIVFVHGVLGDMDNTWYNPRTHQSWPELIASDPKMSGYDVYVYGYYSPRHGTASDLNELSTRFGQQLHDDQFFSNYQEIDFITHSMGGLVTKGMLVRLNTPDDFPDLQKVHTVIYLSVPSSGAPIADLASWFSQNPQFSSMNPSESNNNLQVIDGEWRKLLNERTQQHPFPKTFSAYETLPTHGVKVVPALYISQMADGEIIPFDYDHVDIVKPDSAENEVYKWARARLLEGVNPPPPPPNQPAVPPIANPGAPIGTRYEYIFTSSSVECHGEYVKVTPSVWYEKHLETDPPQCLVNAMIFTYTERQSDDPSYYLLYDSGRGLYVHVTKTAVGETSPTQWRMLTDPEDKWNVVYTLTRKQ